MQISANYDHMIEIYCSSSTVSAQQSIVKLFPPFLSNDIKITTVSRKVRIVSVMLLFYNDLAGGRYDALFPPSYPIESPPPLFRQRNLNNVKFKAPGYVAGWLLSYREVRGICDLGNTWEDSFDLERILWKRWGQLKEDPKNDL